MKPDEKCVSVCGLYCGACPAFPEECCGCLSVCVCSGHDADKELFYYGDRIKEPGVAIVSCNDGLRPVIMKLEATDEEARIEYTPITSHF